MQQTSDELIKSIREKVVEKWQKRKEPYLFSSIGADFKEQVEALNGKKLKEWVMSNLEELSADISSHPTQKEKIGLIPKGEIYEYNTEKQTKKKDTHSELKQTSENRKKITMAFISMLGDLPAEDADKIIIPTSVLSKLLGE